MIKRSPIIMGNDIDNFKSIINLTIFLYLFFYYACGVILIR